LIAARPDNSPLASRKAAADNSGTDPPSRPADPHVRTNERELSSASYQSAEVLTHGGAVSAARPIRLSRSTSCGARRRRPSTSLSATCAAATAPSFAAFPTSGAIWSRYAPPIFRRAIRRRPGGRESVDGVQSLQHRRGLWSAGRSQSAKPHRAAVGLGAFKRSLIPLSVRRDFRADGSACLTWCCNLFNSHN
jgi:hypothetical protein